MIIALILNKVEKQSLFCYFNVVEKITDIKSGLPNILSENYMFPFWK